MTNGEGMKKATVGILTVATNDIYVEYWKSFARSVDENFGPAGNVTMHVFTDFPEVVADFSKSLANCRVKAHQIQSLQWPDATLLRYEVFNRFASCFDEEILMHVDADMLFRSSFGRNMISLARDRGMVFVRHPGYFRPLWTWRMFGYYLMHPSRIQADLRMRRVRGGIGDWEDREVSSAFVPRELRRHYVCGGCWFGQRQNMLQLFEELAREVRADQFVGIEAKWHDESHLNRYFAENDFPSVSPSYCFDARLSYLAGMKVVVEAVDKSNNKIR
jgi:hypothetical protein